MASEDSEQHPSTEEISDYFEGRLAPQREVAVELHFNECDACAAAARRIRLLSFMVDRWSAAEHGRAAAESRIVRALERASAAPSCAAWSERLSRWIAGWGGRSEAALRVAWRQAGDSLEGTIESVASLTRAGAFWPEFIPQVAMATRGGPETSDTVVSSSPDAPCVRVAVRPAEGRVEVDIEGVPAGPAPLVMLVPDDPDGQIMLGELRPGSLPARFAAVFEKVAAGEYTLVIEPQAAADTRSSDDRFG